MGPTTGPPLRAWQLHCLFLPQRHVSPEAPLLGLSSPLPFLLSCLSLVPASDLPHFPKVPNPVRPVIPALGLVPKLRAWSVESPAFGGSALLLCDEPACALLLSDLH